MHPLQIRLNPLWICKISKTDTPITLLKKKTFVNLPHPQCCLCWAAVVGKNLKNVCVYKTFYALLWSALCNWGIDFVVLTKVLFKHKHTIYIYTQCMCNTAFYMYKNHCTHCVHGLAISPTVRWLKLPDFYLQLEITLSSISQNMVFIEKYVPLYHYSQMLCLQYDSDVSVPLKKVN